jgi:hypothetical protein
MAHYRIIGNALGYPWVIYVCDVINEHACGPHYLQSGLYGRADTTLNYGTGKLGSIPGAVHFLNWAIAKQTSASLAIIYHTTWSREFEKIDLKSLPFGHPILFHI